MRTVTGSVQGKVIAITGGARGIGYATARRLAAHGARVAIGDIDADELQRAAKELDLSAAFALDVTDPGSFETFLDRVEDTLGPLDVLVNNAGIMPIGPLAEEGDAVSRRIVEINLLGVITGTKLALHRMLPRASGHIVNIASIAGESYVPGGATYCATKHGVKGFTESVRREYRGSGVAFSQVQPTFTNTELITGTRPTPGLRAVEPGEVADAVAALVVRPRPVVRVTRLAGALAASQAMVPRRVGEALARAMGVEKSFVQIDPVARRDYDERVRST